MIFLYIEEMMKVLYVKVIFFEFQKFEENGIVIQKERMCLLLVYYLDVCSRVIEFCLMCDKVVYVYFYFMRKILIKF